MTGIRSRRPSFWRRGGSREPEAQTAFAQIAANLLKATRVGQVRPACLIGSGAKLGTVLADCRADRRLTRVYIVPHLLFDGLVPRDRRERVEHWSAVHGRQAPVVTVTGHIWPDQHLSRDIAAQIVDWSTIRTRERDGLCENRLYSV